MRSRALTSALAKSFLAGEPTIDGLVARTGRTLGRRWKWLTPLAGRYLKTFSNGLRPRHRDVVGFLLEDAGFQRALNKHAGGVIVEQWLTEQPRMRPVGPARTWTIPPLETVGALADWLAVTPGELEWFADLKDLNRKKQQPLGHYHYRVLQKSSGGIRLIEAPKNRLKEIQTRILTGILDRIPAHEAAHGFVKGRSIKTFTAPHVSQEIVLRMDLRDFFPSFCGARIQTMFRTMGYPEPIADLLGGICTNSVPRYVCNEPPYVRPHLPQGAPTSPALANFGAYRADCRLSGLAQSAGVTYTRYADDLAFSGGVEFARTAERFVSHAGAILLEEGFDVNFRKSRIMRRSVRQHLAGLVVNHCPNTRRSDYDVLKATLTNCVRHGPESQNRASHPQFRAHLNGRVSFVEMVNPEKGTRLRRIFEQINWR